MHPAIAAIVARERAHLVDINDALADRQHRLAQAQMHGDEREARRLRKQIDKLAFDALLVRMVVGGSEGRGGQA